MSSSLLVYLFSSLDFSYNLLRTLLPNGPDSPPLDNLPNLHTVYFIQNKISRIEGLDGLADSLRSLELGGNRIRVSATAWSRRQTRETVRETYATSLSSAVFRDTGD